jgi:hypothetical protein
MNLRHKAEDSEVVWGYRDTSIERLSGGGGVMLFCHKEN